MVMSWVATACAICFENAESKVFSSMIPSLCGKYWCQFVRLTPVICVMVTNHLVKDATLALEPGGFLKAVCYRD